MLALCSFSRRCRGTRNRPLASCGASWDKCRCRWLGREALVAVMAFSALSKPKPPFRRRPAGRAVLACRAWITSPEPTKSLPVPADDGFRSSDHQRLAPAPPKAGKDDPEQAVERVASRPSPFPPRNRHPLAEGEVFQVSQRAAEADIARCGGENHDGRMHAGDGSWRWPGMLRFLRRMGF